MASTDRLPSPTQSETIPPAPAPTSVWPVPRSSPEVTPPPTITSIPEVTPAPTTSSSPAPSWPITRETPSSSVPIPKITPTPTREPSTSLPRVPSSTPGTTAPGATNSQTTSSPVPSGSDSSSLSPSQTKPGTSPHQDSNSSQPALRPDTTPTDVLTTVPRISPPIGLSTAAPSSLGSNKLTTEPSLPPGSFPPGSLPPGLSYSAPPPSSAFGQSRSSSSKLALSIAAPLVACLALAVGLFLWNRQRQRSVKQTNSSTNSTSDGDVADPWLQLEEFRVNVAAIELEKRIAMGSFGEVWLATFQKQVVAVKTCSHTSSLEIHSFVNELLLMSTFKSPHIVTFMGAAWMKPTDVKAVLEYMNLGDLRQFLADTTPSSFSWPAKLECALHVARALVYLKSKHVIHRDLKSRNVLLDSAKGTKLGDFGISRLDSNESMTTGVGTYRWMAPEILTFRRYTGAVDVYSFGVLLSELDTHQVPYSDVQTQNGHAVSDGSVICHVIQSHFRPTFSRESDAAT
ncbi:hypothetical protein AeMF1_008044 [Aphanomyces euteiches]|nr:hypothetical protein AeMF1_008044 [Aphanomyces euteiches]